MRHLILIATIAATVVADTGRFLTVRPLQRLPEREELAAVPFDHDIYRATRNGYPDVRVLDDNGNVIPFIIEPYHKTTTVWREQTIAVTPLSLTPTSESYIDIVVQTPLQDHAPDWIEIKTPLQNFEKQVQIALWKAGAWQPVVDQATLYDYSRYMDVRRTRVLLPTQAPAGRYRIRIEEVQDAAASAFIELTRKSGGTEPDEETVRSVIRRRDFRVDTILFGYRQAEERRDVPVTEKATLTIVDSVIDRMDNVSRITVDTGRCPIERLQVHIRDKNVSRRLVVEAHEPVAESADRWRQIASGRIRTLDFRDINEQHLHVDVPTTRSEHLRITIHNGDAPPLNVENVTGEWTTHRIVFLAEPGVPYAVAYGNSEVDAPQLDTDALERLLKSKHRSITTFDLQPISKPTDRPVQHPLLRLINHPATLIGVVGIGVIVLAWAMIRALKGIDAANR